MRYKISKENIDNYYDNWKSQHQESCFEYPCSWLIREKNGKIIWKELISGKPNIDNAYVANCQYFEPLD